MNNPYEPIKTQILKIIPETAQIKTFVLKPENHFEFNAGQFIQLTIPGVGEGPFTPSSSPYEKEKMEVTIMQVGKITSTLHNMKENDLVGIRGPYGNRYPVDEWRNREILIVGGGVGLAPLRSLFLTLTYNLKEYKKIVLCYGAKTPEDIVYKESILNKWQKEFAGKISFRVTVDVGDEKWKGKVGLVTTTLDGIDEEVSNISESIAVVCGPPVMMKFTTLKLLDVGYTPEKIYLSMEKNMSCGIGKCGHCQLGKFLACRDGPVFTYEQLKDIPAIWD
ncbi:FAD/NAD(P)-binding protein [Candidatus Aerophobetes bacterium]|nr:FAD/NAD(P)-binding protein [Candidatus Aerophobetes bacterium]